MKNVLIVFALFLFTACGSDDNNTITDFRTQNDEEILAYIEANNLEATKSNSGLYYVINNTGSGSQPTAADNVTVAYKGYFTNGQIFDQSDANGISFSLSRVIPGWTEGITYFKEGGSGILLIPAHIGYANRPPSSIPLGAVLIFDINLISVN